MAKRYRVEYDLSKCVGQGACVAIAPSYFSLPGSKAVLAGAVTKGDLHILEGSFDENDAAQLSEAEQACPVNAIKLVEIDEEGNQVHPEKEVRIEKEIIAKYDDSKEFVIDDAGYFLIRLDRDQKNIEAAFCKDPKTILLKVAGKKPIDIYHTILHNEKLKIRPEHAAYLGRELQKAYIALREGIEYIQDDELDPTKKFEK